jgi:hypothetical protein
MNWLRHGHSAEFIGRNCSQFFGSRPLKPVHGGGAVHESKKLLPLGGNRVLYRGSPFVVIAVTK